MATKQSILQYCIAIVSLDDRLDIAWVDGQGRFQASEEVRNDRIELMRALRKWTRTHGLELRKSLFCILTTDHAALRAIAQPMRPEVLVWRFDPMEIRTEQGLLPKSSLHARTVAEHAFMFAQAAKPASAALLQHRRIDLLVARRDELNRFKDERVTNARKGIEALDPDLRKEFERMDRRHMRLLDALIARVEALIATQIARDPEGDGMTTLPVGFSSSTADRATGT